MRKHGRWITGGLFAIVAAALFAFAPEAGAGEGTLLSIIWATRKLEGSDLFGAASRRSKRIGSDSLLRELKLALDYGFTHANPTQGTGYADAAYRVWRQIIARGQFNGRSITFLQVVPRDLKHFFDFLDPASLPQTEPDFTTTAGDSETDLRSEIVLPFHALGGNDPSALGLPLRAIKGFEIITDGGAAQDLMSGEDESTAAASIDNPETELFETRFARMRQVLSALMTLHTTYEVSSAQNNVRLYLPEVTPGIEVARVMVVTEVDDAADDGVIDNVGLNLDGREQFEKLPAAGYQRENVRRYDLSAVKDGVVLFDNVDDGDFESLYRISSQERPYVLADFAKAGTARVVTQYVDRRTS